MSDPRGGSDPDLPTSGDEARGGAVELDVFRAALARWASGVGVVAVRDEGRVLATTVSAFTAVSARPPLVLIALGPGAQVLPFLAGDGERFGVSVLGESQARLASVFADPYPIGVSPFPAEGEPLIPDALVRLGCRVHATHPAGDHVLVVALVESAAIAGGGPLVRWDRSYHRLAT